MAKAKDGAWNEALRHVEVEKGPSSIVGYDDYGAEGEAILAKCADHPRGGPNRWANIALLHKRDQGPFSRALWMRFEQIEVEMMEGSRPQPQYDIVQPAVTSQSSP